MRLLACTDKNATPYYDEVQGGKDLELKINPNIIASPSALIKVIKFGGTSQPCPSDSLSWLQSDQGGGVRRSGRPRAMNSFCSSHSSLDLKLTEHG